MPLRKRKCKLFVCRISQCISTSQDHRIVTLSLARIHTLLRAYSSDTCAEIPLRKAGLANVLISIIARHYAHFLHQSEGQWLNLSWRSTLGCGSLQNWVHSTLNPLPAVVCHTQKWEDLFLSLGGRYVVQKCSLSGKREWCPFFRTCPKYVCSRTENCSLVKVALWLTTLSPNWPKIQDTGSQTQVV